MNIDAIIARLEQYKTDFHLHAHVDAKEMICQQTLGFLSALSYTNISYSTISYYADEWKKMSGEVIELKWGEPKRYEQSNVQSIQFGP